MSAAPGDPAKVSVFVDVAPSDAFDVTPGAHHRALRSHLELGSGLEDAEDIAS